MLSERIMYRLKRLHQALRVAMDQALAEAGLTGPQYAVLAALEVAPGSSATELARQCFVTAQTMNEIVQGLTAGGLVARKEPDRGRIVKLSLTAKGRKLLNEAHKKVLALEEQALSALEPAERSRFLALLDLCSSALEGL